MSTDHKFESALRLNRIHWDEYLKEDPELAKIDQAIARGERILATTHPGSTVYDEGRRQFDHFRALRALVLKKRFPK